MQVALASGPWSTIFWPRVQKIWSRQTVSKWPVLSWYSAVLSQGRHFPRCVLLAPDSFCPLLHRSAALHEDSVLLCSALSSYEPSGQMAQLPLVLLLAPLTKVPRPHCW